MYIHAYISHNIHVAMTLQDRGMAHFLLHTYNVTSEQLVEGHQQYLKHGAGPLKKKKDIGPHNVLAQLVMYRAWQASSARVEDLPPHRLLARMFRTGSYYPSPTWAYRGQGRGMDAAKFDAIWKISIAPE